MFAAIADDARRDGLVVLLHEEIQSRSIPDPSMGYRLVEGADGPQGHNAFLTTSAPLLPDAAHRSERAVTRVLEVFRETCC